MKFFRATILGTLNIGLMLLLLCCHRSLGYGVVLWSTDEVLVATGSVIDVQSRSMRRAVYKISHNGKLFEQPVGRVKLFSSKRKAQEYKNSFTPYLKNFVEVKQKRNLPVRLKPDPNSEKIYNLAVNMRAKVLHRSQNRVEIPPYKGYWYKILTKDGTEGYVYGRYLSEFLLTDTGEALYNEADYFGDAVFESLFENEIHWRPLYYKEMIENGHIVPELFTTENGLFLDPEKKYLKLITPETPNAIYSYDKVLPVGSLRYYFHDTGVSLDISDGFATAYYPYNGLNYQKEFISLSGNLADYINTEYERRKTKYENFLKLNSKLESSWGTLEFKDNFRFEIHLSNQAYTSDYFSPLDENYDGKVDFDIFLGNTLAQQFDGALSLKFDNGKELPFLYSFTSQGIGLTVIHNVPQKRVIQDEIAAGGFGKFIEYKYM